MKNNIVISLGGSTLLKEGEFDIAFIKKLVVLFKKNMRKGAIVVGGGEICRKYSKALEKIKEKNYYADKICISITRNNAKLLSYFFKESIYIEDPSEIKNLERIQKTKKYYISGGFFPGYTTDSCSVLVGEVLNSKRMINISNVDGIYNKNPKIYKDAKKFTKIKLEEFLKIAEKEDKRKAGTNFVFDSIALNLLRRTQIKQIDFVGKNLKDIENALKGKAHNGTILKI